MKKEQAGREAAKRRNDVIRRAPIFEEEKDQSPGMIVLEAVIALLFMFACAALALWVWSPLPWE